MRRQSLIIATFVLCSLLPLAASASIPPDEEVVESGLSFVRPQSFMFGLRDEAAMLLVGSALIGLAAAVRRSA